MCTLPCAPCSCSFTVAQLVTYKYFVGRLSMLNSQFAKAEEEPNYA